MNPLRSVGLRRYDINTNRGMGSRNVLRPIDMKVQPATYQDRVKITDKIYAQLERFKPNSTNLGKASVIWEHEVAKKSKSKQGYMFNAAVLLRNILKHQGNLDKHGNPRDMAHQLIKKQDVMNHLEKLIIEEKELCRSGFFTHMYDTDPQKTDMHYATCYRCETKFNVDTIMEPATCVYHVQKARYNKERKIKEFPCCGASLESYSSISDGCTKLPHHVYRFENYTQLSNISPFKTTSFIEGEKNVLALDCEMAFTSKGYEMIRLTIVDFWTSKTLYDEVIQPQGEIIDLNSQFSGIHHIDKETAPTFFEAEKEYLSPKMINKNSILIGHGLDNDLQVMRLIHDRIIDTAVLYPAGKFKSSLKNLSFEVLSRKIQSGEHDSSEDAIASMDVIKKKCNIPLDKKSW